MKKNLLHTALLVFCLFALAFLSGCRPSPAPDKTIAGTILGAGWGAGAGAVIGNQTDASGPGAAIGAGIGAVSGMIHGASLDSAELLELRKQREIDALKVSVNSNHRALARLRDDFDYQQQMYASEVGDWVVFFDPERASLRAGSAVQLQRVANSIKKNPYAREIELHGHSDDTGQLAVNERLSEARARTVLAFLVAQGISADRISVVAHGSAMPLGSNEIGPGRQLNRRVEIVLKN